MSASADPARDCHDRGSEWGIRWRALFAIGGAWFHTPWAPTAVDVLPQPNDPPGPTSATEASRRRQLEHVPFATEVDSTFRTELSPTVRRLLAKNVEECIAVPWVVMDQHHLPSVRAMRERQGVGEARVAPATMRRVFALGHDLACAKSAWISGYRLARDGQEQKTLRARVRELDT